MPYRFSHVPPLNEADNGRNWEELQTLLNAGLTEAMLGKEAVTAAKLAKVEAWKAPTFENSWKNVAGTTAAGYLKDLLGFVHLRGRIESGVSEKTAFTLPAGFRPAGNDVYAMGAFGGAKPLPALCNVLSSGAVIPAFNGVLENVGLGGITFLAEN